MTRRCSLSTTLSLTRRISAMCLGLLMLHCTAIGQTETDRNGKKLQSYYDYEPPETPAQPAAKPEQPVAAPPQPVLQGPVATIVRDIVSDTSRRRFFPHALHLRTREFKNLLPRTKVAQDCGRGDWIVYGFHPSWASSNAYKSYQFDLLTHVAFFGYQVNVKTGGPNKPGDLGNWATTPLVDSAHANGCKVHLVVETVLTNGSSYSMLTNPTVSKACIDSICYYVRLRHADGVCVDFEDMYSESDAAPFLSWMQNLSAALKKDNPNAELTMAGPAIPSGSTFTQAALYEVVDYNVIMGYGYAGNYSGSPNPGCNTPLPMSSSKSGINMVSTVQSYLSKGVAAKQLVFALPYYGGAWLTSDSTAKTPPGTYKNTPTFSSVCGDYPGNGYVSKWDANSQSSYFVQPYDDGYLQAWVLDSLSMALRYDTIKEMGLAGTGMWALSYDAGSNQLWDLLNEKFGKCDTTASTDTSSDPVWVRQWRFALPWGCLAALLILTGLVTLNRKVRNELMNLYWLFPLGAFLLMTVTVIGYESICHYLHCCISSSFPWLIVLGTAILIVGFVAGRWWTERRRRD